MRKAKKWPVIARALALVVALALLGLEAIDAPLLDATLRDVAARLGEALRRLSGW